MNWFAATLGVVIAGTSGYLLEPAIRSPLTSVPPTLPHAPAPSTEEETPVPAVPDPVVEESAGTLPDVEEIPSLPVPLPEPEPEPGPIEEQPEPLLTPEEVLDEEPVPVPALPGLPQPNELPAPAAGDADKAAADSPIVTAMKTSLREGQIKEFTYDEVTSWQDGEEETLDGITYQTGIASHTAQTIFGSKTIQAKALITDNRVVRWVWVHSGDPIR